MKKANYIKLSFFFLAYIAIPVVHAQVFFKDKHIQHVLTEVVDVYKHIDSIVIGFEDKKPSGLVIFKKPEENTMQSKSKNTVYYILRFEGDQYILRKRLPSLYRLIYDKGHIRRVRRAAKEDTFVWILGEGTSKFRPLIKGSGAGYPNAEFKKEKLEELVGVLNENYHDTIVPTGDSVLLFQAVVESDGTLASELELLSGEKDAFYHYFMETYDYYVKQVLTKSFYKARLYRPHLQNGQRRGLIDIFVRLNKDKTFSISGTGEARVFQLKNFTDDPKKPMFY